MAKDIPPFVTTITHGQKYTPIKLNIDGGDDPFYRYKVVQLIGQVTGKGRSNRTLFLNLDRVAANLHLTPEYIIGWLASVNNAKPTCHPPSISGNYSDTALSRSMSQLISTLVLCSNCGLPELVLKVRTKIRTSCHSCGHQQVLSKLSDRFEKFIRKHPPAVDTTFRMCGTSTPSQLMDWSVDTSNDAVLSRQTELASNTVVQLLESKIPPRI